MKIVFLKFSSLVRNMQILVCNILLNILSVMRLRQLFQPSLRLHVAPQHIFLKPHSASISDHWLRAENWCVVIIERLHAQSGVKGAVTIRLIWGLLLLIHKMCRKRLGVTVLAVPMYVDDKRWFWFVSAPPPHGHLLPFISTKRDFWLLRRRRMALG